MNKKLLSLLFLSTLLSGCSSILNITHDGDNHDVDPNNPITEDDDTDDDSDIGDINDEEGDIETPSEYDEVKDGVIDAAGKYYLKGEYDKISITAKKNSEIYVFLDGATISSTTGAAFSSEKAITLHLVILNNSTNTISNDYVVSETLEEANAFHVKGDVYISGEGTINANSTVKSGIKVSKNLYILDGVTINANTTGHCITAQSVTVGAATLNLTSSTKDGINAESDGETSTYDASQGFVNLEKTTATIDTYGDGIQASTYVDISGGTLNITTHGEFVAYSSTLISSGEYTKDDFKFQKSGNTYKRVASDEIRTLNSNYYALVSSVKGVKAGPMEYENEAGETLEVIEGDYNINIDHLATITVDSTDDCIHCNYGTVDLDSANLYLTTIDDGVHADYDLEINNACIQISNSYEGLEGANVTVDGEDTNIITNSSDDGINAASDYTSTNSITINDGYLRVYASGDGLDANSSLNLNGGTVIVEGPGSNNGSLDAEQVNINGGIVFACSTNGMQERTTATQNSFCYQGNTIAANSVITIANSSNVALFSYTLKQSCSQIIFSCADLEIGSKYLILNGNTTLATISMTSSYTKSGSGSGGGRGPDGR